MFINYPQKLHLNLPKHAHVFPIAPVLAPGFTQQNLGSQHQFEIVSEAKWWRSDLYRRKGRTG